MTIGWNLLIHPLVSYVLLVAGMGLCGYLFVTVKKEIAALRHALRQDQEAQAAELSLLRAGYEEARARLDDLEQQSVQMVAPPPSLSGLNLNKRGQALRLHRAGADPANIARSLQLPEAEVELLLKVHSLGEAPPASSEYAAESPGKTLYGKLQGLPMTSGSEHGAEYARFVDLGGRPASGLE